jgi:hypothetical protein
MVCEPVWMTAWGSGRRAMLFTIFRGSSTLFETSFEQYHVSFT